MGKKTNPHGDAGRDMGDIFDFPLKDESHEDILQETGKTSISSSAVHSSQLPNCTECEKKAGRDLTRVSKKCFFFLNSHQDHIAHPDTISEGDEDTQQQQLW